MGKNGKIFPASEDRLSRRNGAVLRQPEYRIRFRLCREESLPAELEITARSEDGEIMGLRDRSGLAEGVQFHPESVLTEHGMQLIAGFCAKLRNAQGREVR